MPEDIVIRVTVEDAQKAESERNPAAPEPVTKGIQYLEEHLTEKGYEDFHNTTLKNPRKTERGVLYAEGTFAGPSPNGGDDRDPEDFTEYRFLVVEDENYEDLYVIEAYYHTRLLATFEVTSNGLKLLSGGIDTI